MLVILVVPFLRLLNRTGYFRRDGTFIQSMMMRFVLFSGSYEHVVSQELKKLHGELFIDIGANSGYYSLLLRNNFLKVVASEPSNIPHKRLESNLRRFKTCNIVPIKKSVSDTSIDASYTRARYHRPVSAASPDQLAKSVGGKDDKLDSVVVSQVTLSQVFPGTRIDLVKVDVEGSEREVLEGARGVMQNIKRWVVEVHDDSRVQELEGKFKAYGYETRYLEAGLDGRRSHILAWR